MNLIYELSDLSSAATLSGRFCLTLLHSIWIIALITLIAWCVSRILQSRFVEQSYYVCVLGLFASIATLPITYAVLEVSADSYTSTEVIPVAVVTPAPLMAVQHETTDVKPVLTAAAADIEAPSILIHETNEVKDASTSEAMSFLWQDIFPWIIFAYLMGVVLMIVRLARSTYQANQLSSAFALVTMGPLFETLQSVSAKLSNKIVPALALVEQTAMPKVIGVMRPTILLPTSVLTGLSQDELEMILMHELAHIRRHDMWVNLVQRMAEAVLFFNPALWILSRRISTLREYCCDEIACKASGAQENKVTNKESRTRYASALVHIVELTHGHSKASELVSLSIAGRSPSELRRRIARLFDEPLRDPIRITRGGILALIATLVILLASPLAWQTHAQNSLPAQPGELSKIVSQNTRETGRVVNSGGIGIENAKLEFVRTRSVVGEDGKRRVDIKVLAERTSRKDGSFDIPKLDYGSIGIYVSADGYISFDQYHANVSGHVNPEGRIRIVGGEGGMNRTIHMVKTGTISGKVIGPDGKPLAGAPLSIHTDCEFFHGSVSTANHSRVITNDKGEFQLENVPPGEVILNYPWFGARPSEVQSGKWKQWTKPGERYPSAPTTGLCWVQVFNVKESQTIKNVTIDLSKSECEIKGHVTDQNGLPVKNATVQPVWRWKVGWHAIHGLPKLPEIKTDSEGRYHITGLPPGAIHLDVRSDQLDKKFERLPVQLRVGQPIHLDLRVHVQDQEATSTPPGEPVRPLVKEQFPELAQVKIGISKEKWRSALGDSTKSRLFRVDSKAGRKSKYTYKFEIRDTTFFATFANDKMVELDRVKTSEYQNPLAPPAGLSPRETVNQFLDRLAEGKKTINGISESSEHRWAYTTREEGWGLEMIRLAERPAFRAFVHLGNEHQTVVLTAIEKTSVSSVQPRVGVFGLIKKNGRWLIQKMESNKPESAWSVAEGFSRNKDVHWGILRSDIVGSFNYFDINYHFKADGSYRQTERDMATATGTWQLKGDRLIRVIDGKEHSSRILRLFEEGFIVEPKKGYQQGYYWIKPSGKSKTKSTTIDSGDLGETNNEQIPALNPSLMNGQYSFTGTVTTEMGAHNFVHHFKGKTSPNTFECSWEQDMGHMKMTGSVKTNFDAGVFKLLNMKEKKSNAELAIAGASGVSGGSARLMYYLWKGNRSKFFPSKDIKILKKKDLTIITGTYGNSFRTITMKKGNIISIETLSDPAKNKMPIRPEMTDDQIKDVLKATNKEVTPKAVADMKEMLSKAKKSLSQLKDPIKTKTVFTITH